MCSTEQLFCHRSSGAHGRPAGVRGLCLPGALLPAALLLAGLALAGCGSAPSGATQDAASAAHARSWEPYRVQAARRIVAANPQMTYGGAVPEPLLAIPVLEVELNGDGSVRRIEVLRQPSQARETTQMAIDAVRRAAPFPAVSHLPKPWKFAEAFLFNDDKRFKPRSLDVR